MKKTISSLLAIFMLFTIFASFPFTASALDASEAECEIIDADGETHLKYYASLNAATQVAQSGQTIKLLRDLDNVGEGVEFDFNRGAALPTNVTFDMDGHSITGRVSTRYAIFFKYCKDLLVKNGSFIGRDGANAVRVHHIAGGVGSHVTFENVVIDSDGANGMVTAGDTGIFVTFRNCYIKSNRNSIHPDSTKVTVDFIDTYIWRDGSVEGSYMFNIHKNETTINIYSGYFLDAPEHGVPIFNIANPSAVNIWGGTFVSAGNGNGFFSNTAGTVDVWGGQFIAHNAGAAIDRGSVSSTIHAATFAAANNGDLGSSGNAYAFGNFTGGFYLKTYGDIPVMTAGASVRLASDHNGLRFETTFSKDLIDYANAQKDGATEIGYGTLIIAANTVYGGLRSYTHYNLSLYATDGSIDFNGADFRDIQATGEGITVNGDESITATAALIEVQSGNLARNFTAVSYIKYTKNGEDVYIYSFVNSADNTRSMSAIASAALADQNAGYTAEQRAVLQTYVVEP